MLASFFPWLLPPSVLLFLLLGRSRALLHQASSNPLPHPTHPGLLDLLSGLLLAVIHTKPDSALLLVFIPGLCWVSHQYPPESDSCFIQYIHRNSSQRRCLTTIPISPWEAQALFTPLLITQMVLIVLCLRPQFFLLVCSLFNASF